MWNFMQVEIVAEDLLVRPMYGPGGLTREQARAEVQGILDGLPELAPIAGTWRRDQAKDDTVYWDRFMWTVYKHTEPDPLPAALEWLEDLARTMRTAGLDVQVARPS